MRLQVLSRLRARSSPYFFFFEIGTKPNFISKLSVLAQWRTRIQRLNVPILRTANEKPLELEGVMLIHVRIGEMAVPVWFSFVNELAVATPIAVFFLIRYGPKSFTFNKRITLKK